MWRKHEEHKPASPARELVAPSATEPARGPASVPEESAAAGNLTKGICVKGEITGREDLLVDGEVTGSIRITEGKVTVGSNGRVTADIDAREVIVRGRVQGNLHGRERVEIGHTGEVFGDIATRRVAIEEGAMFRGNIEITKEEESGVSSVAAIATGTEKIRTVPIRAKESQR